MASGRQFRDSLLEGIPKLRFSPNVPPPGVLGLPKPPHIKRVFWQTGKVWKEFRAAFGYLFRDSLFSRGEADAGTHCREAR